MLYRCTLAAAAAFLGSHYVGKPDENYCYNDDVRRFHVLRAIKAPEDFDAKQQWLQRVVRGERALYLKKALSLNKKGLEKLTAKFPNVIDCRSEENVKRKLHYLQERFSLNQNYPNPFNPATTIRYSIPRAENVSITIFDLVGREVATLHEGDRAPGSYQVMWNAANEPSGVYFYKLQAGDFEETRSMLLVK